MTILELTRRKLAEMRGRHPVRAGVNEIDEPNEQCPHLHPADPADPRPHTPLAALVANERDERNERSLRPGAECILVTTLDELTSVAAGLCDAERERVYL